MTCRIIPFLILACLPLAAAQAFDSPSTPSGEGNPNLIVCRAPQKLPGSQLMGPKVCKINAVWAQYHRDGMDVAPDGIHDAFGEKYRTLHPQHCRPSTPGGGSIATFAQNSMAVTCD